MSHTEKVCQSDDVIPLKFPIKSTNGEWIYEILVTRGQLVYVPIGIMDKLEEVWGENGNEFRPERWLDKDTLPRKELRTNGWSGLFAFSEGPRMCIGYRLGESLSHFSVVSF